MKYIDSGQRQVDQALGAWVKAFDSATVRELRLQTGFFGYTGLGPLLPIIEHLRKEDGITTCLIGSNDSGTGRDDVHSLGLAMGIPRSKAKLAVCAFGNAYFHPKVIHFRRNDGSQTAYVGSANLTASGVSGRHIEAGVLLDTNDGDPSTELDKIIACIDGWFAGKRPGLFRVDSARAIDDLVEKGVLAKVAVPEEIWVASSKKGGGKALALPKLSPLMLLPAPSSPSKGASSKGFGQSKKLASAPANTAPQFFVMELSKNRPGRKNYQADIGKSAFQEFFGGKIGSGVNIRVNTVMSDGSRDTRVRRLVDVKSKNYRMEIEFPGAYPTAGRPILVFKKLSASEFDYTRVMPEDSNYPEAQAGLSSLAGPPGFSMRRIMVSGVDVESAWPNCPLL